MRALIAMALACWMGMAGASLQPPVPSASKPGAPQQEHPEKPDSKASAQKQTAEPALPLVKVVPPQGADAIQRHKTSDGDESPSQHWWLDKWDWTAISAVVSALAAVVIAWFTVALSCATSQLRQEARIASRIALRTAQAARSSADAVRHSERAYVKLSHEDAGLKWREGEFENSFVLPIRVENFGSTPARITDVLLKPAIYAPRDLPDAPDYTRERSIESLHAFLVRGEHFIYHNPEMLTMGAEDKKAILSGRKILYVLGYVDYEDAFGAKHRGGYARQYRPDGSLSFITDPGFNYDEKRP